MLNLVWEYCVTLLVGFYPNLALRLISTMTHIACTIAYILPRASSPAIINAVSRMHHTPCLLRRALTPTLATSFEA